MIVRLTASQAALYLREGKLVAFPTETVYGLGADALNEDSVRRLFAAKKRPADNPLICHLPDAGEVFRYGKKSPAAEKLAEFWPGPLTVLLQHEGRIPGIVTAGSVLAAFRVPDHELALQILREAKIPVAAPSANLSGMRSPTSAGMVDLQMQGRIDGLVDGGKCRIGLESTVVKITDDGIAILRPGAITREMLENAGCGPVAEEQKTSAKLSNKSKGEEKSGAVPLESPGRKESHYAPAIPLILLDADNISSNIFINISNLSEAAPSGMEGKTQFVFEDENGRTEMKTVCLIAFGGREPDIGAREIIDLSPAGRIDEAAARLYAAFEEASYSSCDYAAAFIFPDEGLGHTINDRLRRASLLRGRFKNGKILISRRDRAEREKA